MYKIIISILLSAFSITILLGQSNIQVPGMPESAVITMSNQQKAWNAGNLDEFMIGYWESDSLLFIGGGGVTSGYEATLKRYKRGYPDVESMGHLTFSNRSWTPLGRKTALLIGSWRLNEDVGGMYSLVWQKIKGHWYIIADHSSD
jgi:hypothetical protein